jgi:uncharacterized delta-60 repeat protein
MQAIVGSGWPAAPSGFIGWASGPNSPSSDQANGVILDASGNVYVCGSCVNPGGANPGANNALLIKYNSLGSIQWQVGLDDVSGAIWRSVVIDSSGNVYVCGSVSYGALLNKYNSSGTLQWQKTLGLGVLAPYFYGITIDFSDNLYLCGTYTLGGQQYALIVKYDSSGTLQWQKRFYYVFVDEMLSIKVDSSGNLYAVGYSYNGGQYSAIILKYNTSGTLQWQRVFELSSYTLIANSVTIDTSGNIYVCGRGSVGGSNPNYATLVKYNSSGTLQWQRALSPGGTLGISGLGISIDTSNNLYICGALFVDAFNQFLYLAKYNSSGAIQWQRTLQTATQPVVGLATTVNNNGHVYVCGKTTNGTNTDLLIAKFPTDGSLTGTYSVGGYSYTYAASSLTDSAGSFSDGASGRTSADSTLSVGTGSGTSYTSTLTSSVTQI